MRLIDADALLKKTVTCIDGSRYITEWRVAEAPTIDAVPVDKIHFTDLYLDGSEAIAVFRFGNQGITLRKKCEDFAPVVHGRWIPTYHKYYNRDGECLIADEWHCSECGVRHRDKWNYCPNCGAKMDVRKEKTHEKDTDSV